MGSGLLTRASRSPAREQCISFGRWTSGRISQITAGVGRRVLFVGQNSFVSVYFPEKNVVVFFSFCRTEDVFFSIFIIEHTMCVYFYIHS